MREVTSHQEFAAWRRTAKPGERVLYYCNRPTFDRDIAIENAILDTKDVKVSGFPGNVVLTKKHIRGRGKGGRPQGNPPIHILPGYPASAQGSRGGTHAR